MTLGLRIDSPWMEISLCPRVLENLPVEVELATLKILDDGGAPTLGRANSFGCLFFATDYADFKLISHPLHLV